MTLELILQTKYLRKFLPQLATLVVAKLFDDLRASLAARERQKEDVVQGFERVYAAPLTGPVEHGIQRTATHSWCGATWLRSSQADGPLDRPLGRPVEFAKAGNAAFRVSLAEDQVRAVLPRLSIDDDSLVLDTEAKREGEHAGSVCEPGYVDDIDRIVAQIDGRLGDLARLNQILALLDIVWEHRHQAADGVALKRADMVLVSQSCECRKLGIMAFTIGQAKTQSQSVCRWRVQLEGNGRTVLKSSV